MEEKQAEELPIDKKQQQSSNLQISEYLKQVLQKLSDAIDCVESAPKNEEEKNVEVEELTLEEKIKLKSTEAPWDIVELSYPKYTFNFMFETIVFEIHLAESSENVTNLEFYSQFAEETSHPTAVYIHHILKKKFTRNFIISAIGEPYTILSILDLITMTGVEVLDILNEFDDLECRHGVVINNQLEAEINFFNIHMPVAFKVAINLKNLQNICDNDVIITTQVGEINENGIKRLIEDCPRNIKLLRDFIPKVENYLKRRTKRKKH